MAQHEDAAGDAISNDDAAAFDTLEDAAEAFGELKPLDDEPLDPNNPEAVEEEAGEADAPAEDDVEDVEAELPPIDAPVSWTAEEKEAFKALPREMQETVTRRESERERFVQSKAQEARSAAAQAEQQALAYAQQIKSEAAEQLNQYAAMFQPQRPDPRLLQQDPTAFYQMQAQYEHDVAQRQAVQQQAQQARAEAEAAQQALEAREAQEFRQKLSEHFPEFLDPSQQAKLSQELSSIALELGYSSDQITQASADDILAMRKAADWKAKASKYDALMAKKMEAVRDAKKLPKVARPGSAQPAGSGKARDYQASMGRLKQTGSLEDAAAALSRL